MADLVYDKIGTRLAVLDEDNESLQDFVHSGARTMCEGTSWELLAGPVERVPRGQHDGEEVVAYLWPIARPKDAFDRLGEALDPILQTHVLDSSPKPPDGERDA